MDEEIDYGGLQEYIKTGLLDDRKHYLFSSDPNTNEFFKNDILTKAYNYSHVYSDKKREVVVNFFAVRSIEIIKEYYFDKLDGKYKLLYNFIVDSILQPLSAKMNEIPKKTAYATVQLLK